MKKIITNREEFIKLYDIGLNDVEISKHYNCNTETVRLFRIKLNLNKNFTICFDIKTVGSQNVTAVLSHRKTNSNRIIYLWACINHLDIIRITITT